MMNKLLFSAFTIGHLMISSALGAITYIDSKLNNTTIAGSTPVSGVNYSTDYANIEDNLWGWRSRSDVNGGYVWVTDGGAVSGEVDLEDTAPLSFHGHMYRWQPHHQSPRCHRHSYH